MYLIPIGLLAVLVAVVFLANASKKKGTLSESSYRAVVNAVSILVTIAAIVVLVVRLRA